MTIASGQAGMVAYTVFRDLYGRARFHDLNGLAGDDFQRCPGERVRAAPEPGSHCVTGSPTPERAACLCPTSCSASASPVPGSGWGRATPWSTSAGG